MCPKPPTTDNELCQGCQDAIEWDVSGDPRDTIQEIIHYQWCEILHDHNPNDPALKESVKETLHQDLDTKFDSNAEWTVTFKEIATRFVLEAGEVAWNQENNSWGEASEQHLSDMALFYATCRCEEGSKAIRASYQLYVLANSIYGNNM